MRVAASSGLSRKHEAPEQAPENMPVTSRNRGDQQFRSRMVSCQEKTFLFEPWARGRTGDRLQNREERAGNLPGGSALFQDAVPASQRMDFDSRRGKARLGRNRRIGEGQLPFGRAA